MTDPSNNHTTNAKNDLSSWKEKEEDEEVEVYEEIEIEDLFYDSEQYLYTYPCPCGDKFQICLEELWDGGDIALCPSCTLRIRVIFEKKDLPPLPPELLEELLMEEEEEEEEVTTSPIEKSLGNMKALVIST